MGDNLKTIKDWVVAVSFFGTLVLLMAAGIILPDTAVSKSERRKLMQVPEYSDEKLWSGRFFSEWEEYLLEQFPARDGFRTIHAEMKYGLMRQKDNNGIYVIGDSIYKMESSLNEEAVIKSAEAYNRLAEKYFRDKNANIYYSVIPDKNYYTASQNGYLSLDYDKLYLLMHENLKDMTEIDIRDLLTAQDYYRTDLHWNQTNILQVADRYLSCMDNSGGIGKENYLSHSFEGFEGSYYGQAALPLKKDTLTYLTNDTLDACTVYDYEKNGYISIYDDNGFNHVDAYDVFLGGPRALLEITNPGRTNGKQLVVFRDSFASSILPFFAEKYSSVIAVDLRYINSDYIGNFITFEDDCDVLFLHNTLILNQYGVVS